MNCSELTICQIRPAKWDFPDNIHTHFIICSMWDGDVGQTLLTDNFQINCCIQNDRMGKSQCSYQSHFCRLGTMFYDDFAMF